MNRAVLDKHTILCVVEAMADASGSGAPSAEAIRNDAAKGLETRTIMCRCATTKKKS